MVCKRLWRTKTQWDFSATQSDSDMCQRSNEGHVLTIQAWQVQDHLILSWDGESDDKQDTKERKGYLGTKSGSFCFVCSKLTGSE